MNRNELRAEIARKGISIQDFCLAVQISQSSYHRKMQDPRDGKDVPEFTQGEISRIVRVLGLSKDQLCSIFFDQKVS